MTAYSTLTAPQRERADYLFADAIFGTNPHAYEYELKGDDVIGRSRLNKNGEGAVHARKPRTVQVNVFTQEVPTAYITLEMDRHAEYAIQDLARSIVKRLVETQPQEIP
jgi:hypothetical protein